MVATIDHDAELAKAGAGVEGKWGAFLYFCRRYPLGAAGGLIFAVFVLAAIFADVIAPHDPLATKASASLAASTTWRPALVRKLPSLAMLVVLPAPLIPTTRMTVGPLSAEWSFLSSSGQ